MYWPWYFEWWYAITITATALISFLSGYYERKLSRKRMKGVRFYKPKDNLCAVYDAEKKLTYWQFSVDSATELLKTLNQLYYKEEISLCQTQKTPK